MNAAVPITPGNMAAFLSVWYFFTITTYGTNVPAGLFLPGMIIGCALGATVFNIAKAMDIIDTTIDPVTGDDPS